MISSHTKSLILMFDLKISTSVIVMREVYHPGGNIYIILCGLIFKFKKEFFYFRMNDLSRYYDPSTSNWLPLYFRQPDLCDESPGSSEYSTGSTLLSNIDGNKMEHAQAEICSLHQDIRTRSQSIHIGEHEDVGEFETGVTSGATIKQGNEILHWIEGLISFLCLFTMAFLYCISTTGKNI